jgi:hypothetical protein
MSKKILIGVWLMISVSASSCKKFLEVNPKSSLSEKQMFESEVGFQQALTGVYSQMAGRDLYGDNLSMGFVSALANNYAVSGSTTRFVQSRALNYTSSEVIDFTNAIWSNSYAAIAGVNKIILNTKSRRNVLSNQNYDLIRGEALGLRAYLHFELLCMFGAAYINGANIKAIPYKKTVDQYAVVPSTISEVVSLALEDLSEAADLLKNSDPILNSSPDRRIKMNYYAVKALEARIRMYSGDKPGAFAAAQIVVSSGKMPFVTVSSAGAAKEFRDRLYITEQVFCLRVRDIKNWVETDPGYFRYSGGVTSTKLTRSSSNFLTLYENSSTDIRYRFGIENDNGTLFPSKFWQTYGFNTLDANRLDQFVPMIRISEMYYIMAEASSNPTEGVKYLNMVRQNRVLPALPANISASDLTSEITKEYQKEFYAEGQVFYYYKRKNMNRRQFSDANVLPSQFILPIPDSEKEFNPNY